MGLWWRVKKDIQHSLASTGYVHPHTNMNTHSHMHTSISQRTVPSCVAKLWQFALFYNMKGSDISPVWIMAEHPVPATVSPIILPSFYQSSILHHLKCHSFQIFPIFSHSQGGKSLIALTAAAGGQSSHSSA